MHPNLSVSQTGRPRRSAYARHGQGFAPVHLSSQRGFCSTNRIRSTADQIPGYPIALVARGFHCLPMGAPCVREPTDAVRLAS
jgi:hypothetical protein